MQNTKSQAVFDISLGCQTFLLHLYIAISITFQQIYNLVIYSSVFGIEVCKVGEKVTMYVSPGLFYFQQFIFKKFKCTRRSESSRKVQFKDFWRKLIPPYLTLPQIKYWHLEYYVYFGKWHISTNLQLNSPSPPGNRFCTFLIEFFLPLQCSFYLMQLSPIHNTKHKTGWENHLILNQ